MNTETNIEPDPGPATAGSGRRSTGRRRSRFTRTRIVLASVALLGVGAAITTAAWSDDVFFGATAAAASFDLQGAPLGAAADCESATGWDDVGVPGNTSATTTIDISTTELGALQPGEAVTVTFCLFNDGTLSGDLVLATPTISGTLDLTTADLVVALAGATIAPGGFQTGTLTVTPPADWTSAQFDQTATIVIQVTGTSI